MSIKVISEQEVFQQVTDVLLEHLSPSMVARFLAASQLGGGDYVQLRRQLFEGETVETLTEKIKAYEQTGERS